MKKEREDKTVHLIVLPEHGWATNVRQTIDLAAQRCILVVIAFDEITIILGRNSALAVHLNTTRSSNDFTLHMFSFSRDKGGLLFTNLQII